MIIRSSKEADFKAKEEGSSTSDVKISKAPSGFSTSTSWSRLKDPRIVRVSRAFGGKDRHSKVWTVRGLRDRRIRLSVPTAIQLYDLQDQLGFNQPSKVVDWLLNAAKNDIDELPPLPIPPSCFGLNHQSLFEAAPQSDSKQGLNINSSVNWTNDSFLELASPKYSDNSNNKEYWAKRLNEDEEKQGDPDQDHGAYVNPSNNFLPRPNHSSVLPAALLSSNAMPAYNSFFRWDASNLSLSHSGSHGLNLTPQTEDFHNFNIVPLPSTLPSMASSSSSHQVFVCPPGNSQPYNFPSNASASTEEFDPKQIINFQMLGSGSRNPSSNSAVPPLYSINQPLRSFNLISMSTPKRFPSQNNDPGREPHKEHDFTSQ